jgi:branched-chain amino acid transport system substrate-binding protein
LQQGKIIIWEGKQMGKRRGFLLAATALAALVQTAHAADKLTIGFMTTLSGPGAVIGVELRDGMLVAMDHLNKKVGGLPTNVIVEDDQ